MAFSLILAHVKNTRPIYYKNLLWTVFLYIQRIVFHFYCKHYLGSVGTIYGERIKLLADPKTPFLPRGKRYQHGASAHDSSGKYHVVRRIRGTVRACRHESRRDFPDAGNDATFGRGHGHVYHALLFFQ